MRPRIVEYFDRALGLHVFGWIIPTPQVIYAIAFVVVVWMFARRCQAAGLEKGIALDSCITGGIAAMVMSRLVYVVFYMGNLPAGLKSLLSAGGTASWGVYGGALVGAYLYLRAKKQPVLKYLDILATVLPLGTFIGRWSCFMHGCDYGTITNVPWGVRYPAGSLAHAAHVNDFLIDPTSQLSLTVHPNQIYLSLNALVIFVLITWIWKHFRNRPGLTLGFYGLAYGCSRFLLEFFRDVPGTRLIPALNPPQVASTIVAASSLLLIMGILFSASTSRDRAGNLGINRNMGG